jgi:hypothetical protein
MNYSRLTGLTLAGAVAVPLLLVNCGGSSGASGLDAAAEGGATGTTTGTTTGADAAPPAACTETPVPATGGACMATDTTCTTATGVCTCGRRGPGGGEVWTCVASCPATAPTMGGTCTGEPGGGAGCVSGADTCRCEGAGGAGGARTWVCTATPVPVACPAAEPTVGETCTTGTGDCPYTTATCTCPANGEWACVAAPPMCPATEPAAGGTCTAGTGGMAGCPYAGPPAATCRCVAGAWTCG